MKIDLHRGRRRQGGVFAVEFAMLAVLFFLFLFAMLEVARARSGCSWRHADRPGN